MADSSLLRNALAAFLGEDRFHKFLHEGFRRGRLRYWQQQDWNRFLAAHQDLAVGIDELEVALRFCELHKQDLCPDKVGVFHGCLDYSDKYIKAMIAFFPYAASDVWSTEGMPFDGDHVDVWYCPACREAKAAWQFRTRRHPPAY